MRNTEGRPPPRTAVGERREPDQAGDAERREAEVARVEDRDDQHGAEVVDDRERQEEDLERERDARAEERQDADREGDVGRHRHAPAGDRGLAQVEPGVDRRRHHHAAERGHHRQGGALPAGELADQELALDLEADDEEEDRHQAVVDPVREREVEARAAERDPRLDVLHVPVEPGPGRVGPSEGDERRGDQDDAGGALGREEALDGTEQSPQWRGAGGVDARHRP